MPDPLHPVMVHLPLTVAVLMPLLTLGLWLAWWRRWLPRRAWVLVVVLQALLVGGTYLALETGEREEDRVELVVPHAAIEAHEEAAESLLIAAGVVLAVALAALVVPWGRISHPLALVTIAGSLVVAVLAVQVGKSGGELVYRHNAGSAYSAPGTSAGGVADQD